MLVGQTNNKLVNFREKLLEKKPIIGTLLTMPALAVPEALSRLGFDYLWIDMEHASLRLKEVERLLRCIAPPCSGLVRIPNNDETWIKQVLDLGADGIIIPQIKTKQDAARAVKAAKYPPLGNRSVGIARAQMYGMDFVNYVSQANESIAVILQIEHKDGVQNLTQILEVPGIDAIVIGPYDLSGSFGKFGQTIDEEVQAAIEIIKNSCAAYNISCGIFSLNAEAALNSLSQGFQLIAVGIDIHYLWTAAKSALHAVHNLGVDFS